MNKSILIAGVGNIFLGDDAFGVEVAKHIAERTWPAGVSIVDYGIRGFDLAYALLDSWDAVIIVDAMTRGGTPGTLYTIEPNLNDIAGSDLAVNPHGMDPLRVLNLAASLGTIAAKIYIVGCEPADFGDELEGRTGLSEHLQSAVEEASNMVERLVGRIAYAPAVGSARIQSFEVA